MLTPSLPNTFALYGLIWILFFSVPRARAVVVAQLGQLPNAMAKLFWVGAACAVLLVAIDALLLVAAGAFTCAPTWQLRPGAVVVDVVFVAVVAATEEMIVRGLLLARLRRVTTDGAAVVATAAIFAVMHVGRADYSIASVVQYLIDGLLLGWVVLRTGHIWAATGAHVGKNLGVALAFGGSRGIIDPLLVLAPAADLPGGVIPAMDLLTYALVVPMCVFVVKSTGGRSARSACGSP